MKHDMKMKLIPILLLLYTTTTTTPLLRFFVWKTSGKTMMLLLASAASSAAASASSSPRLLRSMTTSIIQWRGGTTTPPLQYHHHHHHHHHPYSWNATRGTNNNHKSRMTTTTTTTTTSACQFRYRVFLAVGSNLGNRFENIRLALKQLEQQPSQQQQQRHNNTNNNQLIRLIRTSFLYETAPMYVMDQPSFLNGAVMLETNVEPLELLHYIHQIEHDLGRRRQGGQGHEEGHQALRNGPRPIDLDILFWESLSPDNDNNNDNNNNNNRMITMDTPELVIPHPRIAEREFVLLPLMDVAGSHYVHPTLNVTLATLYSNLMMMTSSLSNKSSTAVRVLPLPRDRLIRFHQTIIMGILNVTPDSFSDGGQWMTTNNNNNNNNNNTNTATSTDTDTAVRRALEMVQEGAHIIDIGGESTRPGATHVSLQEELQRTIPVIGAIRQRQCQNNDIVISIDTRRAVVARAAVEAGADMVNDVSGGTHDPDMVSTVEQLGVPMVLMHMRGTPQTMQHYTKYNDDDDDIDNNNGVVEEVGRQLAELSQNATKVGIHKWLQVIDPGIGFAKDLHGNLSLLRNMQRIRQAGMNVPILLGTSRKGFIGTISNVTVPKERDYGSVASIVAALCLDPSGRHGGGHSRCDIVRVHNVAATKQAMSIMDALIHHQLPPRAP